MLSVRALKSRLIVLILATLFAVVTFTVSWWHWWTFQYATFDLAFYVQSLWLALHGQWHVSLLDVPMLGNHAEPIVFLLLPLFALAPHPMLFVAAQMLALASMPFTAWRICGRLKIPEIPAAVLSALTLLVPATGYIAMHEFHPEAFSAPLFLLLYEARLSRRWGLFWLWVLLTLGCKENVALLLIVWMAVETWEGRRTDRSEQWRWNIAPLAIALAWLAAYAFWLGPALNGGRVDYGNLYSDLGASTGEMVRNLFTAPHLVFGSLWRAVHDGNLVWAMFVSFALLPLLRPKWLIISAPIWLQHLLSSRPSEWSINFHYAAPILALFWLAAAEVIGKSRWPVFLAVAAASLSLLLQFCIGPFLQIGSDLEKFDLALWNREWKAGLIAPLERDPSLRVCACMPYLSHLATRRELYSLHFLLKGVKTLSDRKLEIQYEPDAVVLDYADDQTFSRAMGFYHPEGTLGSLQLPSSDQLLNEFLARFSWKQESVNSLTVLRRGVPAAVAPAGTVRQLAPDIALAGVKVEPATDSSTFALTFDWQFAVPRRRIPWVTLILSTARTRSKLLLGMSSPESPGPGATDRRLVHLPPGMAPGSYQVSAIIFDQLEAFWGAKERAALATVPIGQFTWDSHGIHDLQAAP